VSGVQRTREEADGTGMRARCIHACAIRRRSPYLSLSIDLPACVANLTYSKSCYPDMGLETQLSVGHTTSKVGMIQLKSQSGSDHEHQTRCSLNLSLCHFFTPLANTLKREQALIKADATILCIRRVISYSMTIIKGEIVGHASGSLTICWSHFSAPHWQTIISAPPHPEEPPSCEQQSAVCSRHAHRCHHWRDLPLSRLPSARARAHHRHPCCPGQGSGASIGSCRACVSVSDHMLQAPNEYSLLQKGEEQRRKE
jgi:hypothetical protein